MTEVANTINLVKNVQRSSFKERNKTNTKIKEPRNINLECFQKFQGTSTFISVMVSVITQKKFTYLTDFSSYKRKEVVTKEDSTLDHFVGILPNKL